jgi:hypothetical protein
MPLSLLWRQLRRELSRYESVLARAATRDAVLAFEGTEAFRQALCDRRPATHGERDALTRAVLAEHRRSSHPLWPTALMIAFSPMLASLRARIRGAVPLRAPDELDQTVVTAFLESLERVALRTNMAARLRSATERAVFRALGREQRRQTRTVPLADEEDLSSRPWLDGPVLFAHEHLAAETEDATSLRVAEARRIPAIALTGPGPRREVA